MAEYVGGVNKLDVRPHPYVGVNYLQFCVLPVGMTTREGRDIAGLGHESLRALRDQITVHLGETTQASAPHTNEPDWLVAVLTTLDACAASRTVEDTLNKVRPFDTALRIIAWWEAHRACTQRTALRASALAKLTTEEREALGITK